MQHAVNEYGGRSGQYQQQALFLRHAIIELHRLSKEEALEVTLVLMPSESRSDKRSVNSYGFSSPKRRSTGPQGRATEALLSPAASDRSDKASKVQPSSQPRPVSPVFNALASTPIPSRFNSRLACERITRNCTGHGVCRFLYNETVANQDHEYFGCACTKPEVRTNRDGSKKTTWFGGAACQKKDVAAPFWLLTSVTVLLVSIVSMGVGLLFSMGSEELPSVIGAGVSGPRPK
jgi:Domain of unknown function (DUF3844)